MKPNSFKIYSIYAIIIITIAANYFLANFNFPTYNPKYQVDQPQIKIGIFLMGTGKYIKLIQQLVESMERFFCIGPKFNIFQVHYLIFTDDFEWKPSLNNSMNRFYTKVYQKKLGWPYDTLNRFEMIFNRTKMLELDSFDYLYWLDADMRFVDNVCVDILSDLVGTQHPHYPSRFYSHSYIFHT
jgi:hypothetical protein